MSPPRLLRDESEGETLARPRGPSPWDLWARAEKSAEKFVIFVLPYSFSRFFISVLCVQMLLPGLFIPSIEINVHFFNDIFQFSVVAS